MPGIGIGLSSAFGTKPLFYLLRDEFFDTLAAGSVNGTAATPGPGTRTVVDTGNKLSITSGSVKIAGGAAWGDPGLWYAAQTRVAGRLLIVEFTEPGGVNCSIGWDSNQTGRMDEAGAYPSGGGYYARNNGVTHGPLATMANDTSYLFAEVLRSSGSFHFIKGGAYTTWTLLWIDASGNVATVYPAYTNQNGINWTSSYIRVPDVTWLPTPLVSDGFTDDNGTSLDAHSTDGAGHAEGLAGGIGAGGSGLAWTEQTGDFDIQSNRANPDGVAQAVVDVSEADVVIDCVLKPGGASLKPSMVLRVLDEDNCWAVRADAQNDAFYLYEVETAGWTERASTAIAIGDTDYDVRAIADGQQIDCYLDGGNKISYVSASFQETLTKHGIRSSHAPNEFDNFVIYARDGYSALSAF